MPIRALLTFAALAGALAACGEEAAEAGPDAAPAPIDAGPDATPAPADAGPDATPDAASRPDAGPDATPGSPDLPPLPRAEGPPPGTFDCTADFVDPGRISPVPLGCVLDPDCDASMVVGHRGAGGQLGTVAPENSLAAIRAALVMGLDGVELDVRHTADDRLVLMHDASLARTTGLDGAVDDFTAAELVEVPLLPFTRDDIPGDFGCETVPTLEEAFELTRGRLFVDLDTKTSRVDLVVEAIRAADVVDEVFVSVSSPERAVRARALAPEIRIQIRPDTPDEYAEALALFDRPPEVVEIPGERVPEMAPAIRAAGAKVFANAFGEDGAALLRGDLDLYRARYAEGAHILQSEYPSLLLRALDRWPEAAPRSSD